jgi:septal ring factor EnvC (AmiA/AmiB activator)
VKLAVAFLALLACSKSDAQREKERIQEQTARELTELKQKLGELEGMADSLGKRLDAVDIELTSLTADLDKATDDKARSAIEARLEKLKIEREDIERKLGEIGEQVAPPPDAR